VERIAGDEVTISHGPVASLKWPPMTMGFALPAGGLPQDVSVGDIVQFEFRKGDKGGFEIVAIARTASGGGQ
jgi:Cu(I)/Ag(I) efflux system membrane fusion protein